MKTKKQVMALKQFTSFCLAVLAMIGHLLIPGTKISAEAYGNTMATNNMSISWDENGKISSVSLYGKEMIVPSGNSGFVISDVSRNAEYKVNLPVTGGVKKKQQGNIDNADLNFDVTYTRKGNAILVEGTVTDTSGSDRLIRLDYLLPVSAEGMYWYNDISTKVEVKKNADYNTPVDNYILGHKMSLYPYGAVSNGEQAIAIGVPLDPAQSFLIGYKSYSKSQGMTVRLDFALTSKTLKCPSKANFSFVIYAPTDPQWGFRSASQDYYDLFPEYYEVNSNGGGNWLFQHTYEELYGIEDYYFGYNETPTSYKFDDDYGVASFMYTAPAEMWMYSDMPKEPEPTYQQYVDELNAKIRDGSEELEIGYSTVTVKQFAEAIKNSAILSEDMRYFTVGWYAYGPTVCFVTNHNPDLPSPNAFDMQMEKIKASEGADIYGATRDGIYIDNLSGIANLNFREDHFAYVDTPLLWQHGTKQLAIPGYSSIYSYVKAIREYCDKRDELIFANMVNPRNGIAQYSHMVDVMGSECGPDWGWDPTDQRLRRTMAYRKPWMLLLGHATGNYGNWGSSEAEYEVKEDIMKSAVAYGLFANVIGYRVPMEDYEEARPLFRKYTYISVVQDKLGWYPVTYASVSGSGNAVVDCERFGDLRTGAAIFTAYNTGIKDEGFNGTLNVDLNSMRVPEDRAKKLLAYDMVNNTFVSVKVVDGILTYDINLPELDLSAIIIGTKEEIFGWMFERIKDTIERGDKVVADIESAFGESSSELPIQWNELSSRLQSVSNFKTKDSEEAIANAKAFVEGIGAVAAASDDAINAMSSYAQRLSIDVKNIYGDAYAILSGIFGEDGNKDHSVLNHYEGTMNIPPETKPDYGYETEPDYSTDTEPDSNTKKDSDSNLGVIIICAVAAAVLATIGITVALIRKK